jgi:hypothetical protein
MLVLAMQFSRDDTRPEASGGGTDLETRTGAELDGTREDHPHFPEGRQDAPTRGRRAGRSLTTEQ